MLTEWTVSNFKSIQTETELTLGPLTVFAGANSSGKSTFIQSILLVAQTLANKVSYRSVVLNGALTSLGQFDDLKSNGTESDQVTIKFICRPLLEQDISPQQRRPTASGVSTYYGRFNQVREMACEISFDADSSSPQRDLLQIQPRLFASRLVCISRDDKNLDQTAEFAVRYSDRHLDMVQGIETITEIDDELRSGLAYNIELDDASRDEIREQFRSAKPIGCVLRHFLPAKVICSIDMLEEDARAMTIALQYDLRRTAGFRRSWARDFQLPHEVVSVLRDVLMDTINFDKVFEINEYSSDLFGNVDNESLSLKNWMESLRTQPSDVTTNIQQTLRSANDLSARIFDALKVAAGTTTETHEIVQAGLPRQIDAAASYLENYFASALKYLGPLRDAPKPLYPLAPAADPFDVGLQGEHTASILDLHKNRQIKYIPSDRFKEPTINLRPATRTLGAAVGDWLQYLGVANTVQSRDQGKLGHELKVSIGNSDDLHDLTHVGVGVSQVLPILVMCLLADSDSVLVFEQPELHLHPKVQTLLGDFFLSMALCNKQCIIETHSEYIIDRLRFRIAAATLGNEINDQVKIYFVEKPGQSSSFREVVINEYGAISEWPEGFFDQSQQQAEDILRSAAAKRKASRRVRDESLF